MAGDAFITLIGNLTQDPELRHTRSGKAVTTITVAQNSRFFDRESKQWKDGESMFVRCNIWESMAENAAETLGRGMRVIVYGRLKQRTYETDEGEMRWVTEVLVDEIGPALRYAVADVAKVELRAVVPGAPRDDAAVPSPEPAMAVASGDRPPF
ncbi:single-stranded DNA-binding protein [Nocardia panacis]|uniref:Single-stranded DNA-binding protein n=1 Tax=Nocardia panacis TaxID=2340916 RepID=A0A3A4KEF8_9NOCA|nr:single-stranded DNA-binding protein [Nocardia panacis]